MSTPVVSSRRDLAKLSLAALGVVYGDIGTSPLYSLRECFSGPNAVARTEAGVLGVLSLVFWALTLVVVIKYLTHIMRADNRGEGGILALLALISGREKSHGLKSSTLLLFGIFGASLLYGDGVITPAISVLGAVEGLGVATNALEPYVVPITVAILLALFLVQDHGTERLGAIFGPAMLLWFAMIAAMGIPWIARHPEVLRAVDPRYAFWLLFHRGGHAIHTLGAVVLCITGGEALYADMGHFGPRPIRLAWYVVAFPALLLNYFGQGALLLSGGHVVEHPFFELVSGPLIYPVVVVATFAAIIASQALISGAYSLTQQAISLGYCPRMTIIHTSGKAEGQIFVPEVNRALMVSCIALVLAFKSSSGLAAAYGIAVTATMGITSVLFFRVARTRLGYGVVKATVLVTLFLIFDLTFFVSNLPKFLEGGWVPAAIALLIFTLMTTWKRGRAALSKVMREATLPLDLFLDDIEAQKPVRVAGTAVFMTANPDGAPPVLLHHFKHNKVLHERVVLLSVATEHVPEVPFDDEVSLRDVGHGFYQVRARFGFMQTPSVEDILSHCRVLGLPIHENQASFYLGRETLLTTGKSGMAHWRKQLFAILSRNAQPATAFFGLPPNRVVEMGTQIEL